MAIKTTEFDAAKHLSSPESQVELLSDALESGDAGYIANALETIAVPLRRGPPCFDFLIEDAV